MSKAHTFHIPVMGIGFTIDTPLKVSQFGIDSVISLVDDMLLEKLRKMYSGKHQLDYQEISDKVADFRAKRITSYLNMINQLAEKKFEDLKNATSEKIQELKDYFNLLPDTSSIKQEFKKLTEKHFNVDEIRNWIKSNLSMGSIDVNIMTKIDKDNYFQGEKLAVEYNDAHAALRGFANSDLHSSIVLSAGMNPRLYAYMENFEDFYPNVQGELNKKIVLKVSDYRSALIQGRLFAKKGLWVSEYRIESGLNCGGHAFATEGHLLGPILAEFKANREKLNQLANEVFSIGLTQKNRVVPTEKMQFIITAQGGVGTAEEHQFLLDHYQIDSVGWGSPFLLVPEAVSIDEPTLNTLANAQESDLYLSGISPLGVPFNSMRGNTKDIEKLALIANGKPGSVCPKKYVALNNEFTEKSICSASRQYQRIKLKELDKQELSSENRQKQAAAVVEKSCICVGLGTSALLVNGLDTKMEGEGVSVCPGPNMAYFSKKMSLKEITDHIYGRINVISRNDRPNMFIKELKIYIDFLKNKIEETAATANTKEKKNLFAFVENLKDGINYYDALFNEFKDKFKDTKNSIFNELEISRQDLQLLYLKI
ncbi:MAG: hypothetical protein JW729_09470 [Bacteroidales bacterium]|nr:hypothetical protein [Bacteroidales bacterium]